MARPFPNSITVQAMKKLNFLPGPITFLIALTALLSLFSLVSFLCGSAHGRSRRGNRRTVRLGGPKKPVIEKMSSKALLMAKMISWRKVQDEGEAQDSDSGKEEDADGVVWKKTIIKGEKCRPIDFSGKILYDADGNLLTDD
ncbi:solute carrier family 2 [Striga asiatica]|uniref:Solute carrier family 2 n=1 Tax=Striga asiatica TaxID=4170 RepID=A0A5A7QBC3_STRAF|nr:solute carrier family 2 [Striga asiatica]